MCLRYWFIEIITFFLEWRTVVASGWQFSRTDAEGKQEVHKGNRFFLSLKVMNFCNGCRLYQAHSREKPFRQERAPVPFDFCVDLRNPVTRKRKWTPMPAPYVRLCLWSNISIQRLALLRAGLSQLQMQPEAFSYLVSLIVLEYPRFRGTNILQSPLKLPREDCSLLPRCDGVDRVPTVSSSWCHSPAAQSLSYSTAGTGVLVHASLIHAVVLRAAIFACVISLSDMRVACAAFGRGVKLLRCEVFHWVSQDLLILLHHFKRGFSFIRIQVWVTESTLQTGLKMYIDVYKMHVSLGPLSSHWLSGCDFHTEKKMWPWLMALKINQWTRLLVNKKRCQKNADGKRKEKNPHCLRWATANHHCTRIRFALLENSLSFVRQRVVQEVWMLGCVFVLVPSHYNFQRALFVHVWRSYKSRYRVSVCCVKNGETCTDFFFFFFWSRWKSLHQTAVFPLCILRLHPRLM